MHAHQTFSLNTTQITKKVAYKRAAMMIEKACGTCVFFNSFGFI